MSGLLKRIVIPVNGGAGDDRAIRIAAQISAKFPISLTLIFVVEVVQTMPLDAELPTEIDRGEAILRHAEDLARSVINPKSSNITIELLQARSAGAAIVDESIERRSEMIILAARTRTKFGKAALGETVGTVLKTAPCEVMLLRLPLGVDVDAMATGYVPSATVLSTPGR